MTPASQPGVERAVVALKDKDNKTTFSLTIFYPFEIWDSDKFTTSIFLRWKRPQPSLSTKKDEP